MVTREKTTIYRVFSRLSCFLHEHGTFPRRFGTRRAVPFGVAGLVSRHGSPARLHIAKEFAMDVTRLKASAAAVGVVEVHRSLTRTDLLLCLLPVAAFLSIVSLV